MKGSRLTLGLFLFMAVFSSAYGWSEEWSTEEELSLAHPTFVRATVPPQIGMDKKGNAFAVWASEESLGQVIMASRFDVKSKTWSIPVRIGGVGSQEPRLAVTQHGKAIVVWKKLVDGKGRLFFSAYRDDWLPESVIDSSDLSHQGHPSVGVDELGHAIVVWQAQLIESDQGPLASVIRSATYQFSSSSFGQSVNLSTDYSVDGHSYVGQPEVAVNASGKAVAVWRYNDGIATATRFRIQANSYQSGLWGLEENVSTSPTAQLILPFVAISPNGEVIVTWLQTGFNYYVVSAAVKRDTWGPSTTLSNVGYVKVPLDAENSAYLSHAAFDKQGNAIVAWSLIDESVDQPLYSVQVNAFQKSSWTKTSTLLESRTIPGSVKIAVDDFGNGWAVFAYRGYDEESCSILASRFIQEMHVWSVPESLSTETNSFFPNVCTNPKGNFHSIWIAEKQKLGTIQSARWNAPFPLPPRRLKGRQIKNEFATRTNRVNIITWEAPAGGSNPFSYQIYRDPALTDLVAEIPANGELKFQDPLQKNRNEFIYYFVTVDRENRKSIAMKFVMKI